MTGWRTRAACIGHDAELFFPISHQAGDRTGQIAAAKAICGGCSVRAECLDDAIRVNDEFGIRGGTLPDERRAGARAVARGRREQAARRAAADARSLPDAARTAVDGADGYGNLPTGTRSDTRRALLRAGLAEETMTGRRSGSAIRLNRAGRELAAARRAQMAGAAR